MIEKLQDLGLEPTDEPEVVNKKIQDKLGVSVLELTQALSEFVSSKAEELTLDLVNIAPLGDFSKLLEDNDSMSEFLKTEAHKPEHWQLFAAHDSDVNKSLIVFNFHNLAIDDGDTIKGFVFVSKAGKIKHAFAQNES